MDHRRFDSLARTLGAAKTRRGVLASLAALAAGLAGSGAASGQNACPPGQTADRRGKCSCPAGTDPCPDGCFDLKRDATNCGGCGRTCLGSECRKGKCACPRGTADIGGECICLNECCSDADCNFGFGRCIGGVCDTTTTTITV